MKEKITTIFWGIVLIIVAGILLAETLGYIEFDILSDQAWILVFGVGSAAFFLSYFLNGVRKWGWLFPAFIFAALAFTIWIAISGLDIGASMGAPILAAIALPFYVGYGLNRRDWGLLIPAFVMTVLTIITVMADTARDEWIGALVMLSIGLPFLVVYLVNRSKRWALIPAFIFIVLAVIVFISGFAAGEWVGALVMYAIALPFLVVYLMDRNKRWALIPAIVMGVFGTLPLIVLLSGGGDLTGAIVMFLFSLPFFFVYFRWKEHWWAFIPAGIFASIGILVVVTMLLPDPENIYMGFFRAVLFLGFAITFGVLWLRRKSQPTRWAVYPTLGFLVLALVALLLGKAFQDYWTPILLLALGVTLLVIPLVRKNKKVVETVPPPSPPIEKKPEEKSE